MNFFDRVLSIVREESKSEVDMHDEVPQVFHGEEEPQAVEEIPQDVAIQAVATASTQARHVFVQYVPSTFLQAIF
jgi:hypothetical protein